MPQNSPPTILIATKNTDKFEIVVDILRGIGLNNYQFSSLVDFNISEEMEETGTTENRA